MSKMNTCACCGSEKIKEYNAHTAYKCLACLDCKFRQFSWGYEFWIDDYLIEVDTKQCLSLIFADDDMQGTGGGMYVVVELNVILKPTLTKDGLSKLLLLA